MKSFNTERKQDEKPISKRRWKKTDFLSEERRKFFFFFQVWKTFTRFRGFCFRCQTMSNWVCDMRTKDAQTSIKLLGEWGGGEWGKFGNCHTHTNTHACALIDASIVLTHSDTYIYVISAEECDEIQRVVDK